MTKLVRIYELRVKEEIVPEFTDYIDTHHYNIQDTHVVINRGQPWLMDVTTAPTKIQEFRENKIPEHLRQYKHGNPVDEIKVDKTYIVIDEDLEKLLSAKHNSDVMRQARKYTTIMDKLKMDHQCSIDVWSSMWNFQIQKINTFNNLPWYKRIWRGFNKNI